MAVDTSSNAATVAVTNNKTVLGEFTINYNKSHSVKIAPIITNLLDGLGIKASDIDCFAAALGPGSFTGIRIGITNIKSMAFALNKPTVGVYTLDALAYNISPTNSLICPIMDARNNQVYSALYNWDNEKQNRISDFVGMDITQWAKVILSHEKSVIFLGDAVVLHKLTLQEILKDRCYFATPSDCVHRASSVALLAYESVLQNSFSTSYELLPYYLRKPQAERELLNDKT